MDMLLRSPNRRHDMPLLFKYATSSTAAAILASQSLRYSSPLLFNDPFDVPRHLDLGFTFVEFREEALKCFADYLGGNGLPGSPNARRVLDQMRKRIEDRPVDAMLNDLGAVLTFFTQRAFEKTAQDLQAVWDDRVPGMRICCFSETAASPAMWAHYGDHHRGAVLQFESSDERDSLSLMAQPVRYQNEKPSLPPAEKWARALLGEAPIDWDGYLHEYFFAKAAEWSYEREYRVSTHKKENESGLFSDYVFHPLDLRGLVVGSAVSAEDEAALRAILHRKYPHAALYHARINLNENVIAMELVAAGAA